VRVAVVLPVRDAESLLPDCLGTVTSQTRAPDEVFIVVGPSDDGSMALATRLAGPSYVVRDNPAGDRGSAINIALDETRADVVAMVDVRARLAPDYLETALMALEQHAADVVGGPMRPRGHSAIGRAMAMALQSPFGIGDSRFHFAGKAREVESVYLGVYRTRAFARVGRYSPVLLRTEDDDMNARIREAGFQIWLDPAIRSTYLCRESLAAVWRQYHGYGYWKVALAAARPGAIRLRHLAPAAFVLALLAAAVTSVIWWSPALPVVVVLYFLTGWTAALLAPGGGAVARLLFPFVTLTMHLAYGTGTLMGLLAWPRLRALVRRDAGP
jgi:succinoglycan biosynthesis protein ExoA